MATPKEELKKCERTFLNYHVDRLQELNVMNHEKNVLHGKSVVNALQSGIRPHNDIIKLDAEKYVVFHNNPKSNQIFATSVSSSGQPYYHFSHPIIEFSDQGDMIRNYKNIKTGDKLFIWATVSRNGKLSHLSAVIETEKIDINFGLGYDDEDEQNETVDVSFFRKHFLSKKYSEQKKALLFSPDHVFEYKLYKQLFSIRKTYVKLVAVTNVTDEFVSQLNEEFDSIKKEDVTLSLRADLFPAELEEEERKMIYDSMKHDKYLGLVQPIEILQKRLDEIHISPQKNIILEKHLHHDLEEKKKYEKIVTEGMRNYKKILKENKIALLFASYFIKLPFRSYCKYSGTSSQRRVNCASFLQNLFQGVLHCGFHKKFFQLHTDSFASNPDWCHQKFKSAPISKC